MPSFRIKSGIQFHLNLFLIPAFAGMTNKAIFVDTQVWICREWMLLFNAVILLLVCPGLSGIGESRNPMHKHPTVYILASKRNGTLYVGVTSDLAKRAWQHKNNLVKGFSKRYSIHQLVWYEMHENMESAIQREKRLKTWKRSWKLDLIENTNPGWKDLYQEIS